MDTGQVAGCDVAPRELDDSPGSLYDIVRTCIVGEQLIQNGEVTTLVIASSAEAALHYDPRAVLQGGRVLLQNVHIIPQHVIGVTLGPYGAIAWNPTRGEWKKVSLL